MGTIAGDNTILVICDDDRKASRLERRIKTLARL
jgi:arginine repressor